MGSLRDQIEKQIPKKRQELIDQGTAIAREHCKKIRESIQSGDFRLNIDSENKDTIIVNLMNGSIPENAIEKDAYDKTMADFFRDEGLHLKYLGTYRTFSTEVIKVEIQII